jgi:hypothetical protein
VGGKTVIGYTVALAYKYTDRSKFSSSKEVLIRGDV